MPHTIYLLPVLVLMALISCQEPPQDEIIRLDNSRIHHDSLDAHIQFLMEEAQIEGLGIASFPDIESAYQKTFGYRHQEKKLSLRDSSNIYGASLSKAVFAVLVLQLVDEGLIDLDTPLQSYLPKPIYEYEPQTRWHDNYSDLRNDSLYHKITARHCLTHTTGFHNWRWIEPDQKLRVHFEPGSRYFYSGGGFVYLQVVLEKMTGKPLEALAQEKIFRPLGMSRSSYEWQSEFEADYAFGHNPGGEAYKKDKDNEARGGSTLETTLEDYSTFLQAILQEELLSKQSYGEMFSTQIRIRTEHQFGLFERPDTNLYDPIRLGYGLGWGIIHTPHGIGAFKEGHGSGFQHYSILFPERGKGVLLMSNSDKGESIFKYLLELTLADSFTPWRWEGYIPYDQLPHRR